MVPRAVAILRVLALASHLAPTVGVTVFTALLARAAGHGIGTGAVVTAAVFTGQLSIGWSNDLLDAERDRANGRRDKPLVCDPWAQPVVQRAVVVALLACLGLSLACGVPSASTHLLFGVGAGWAYNAWLKRTAWSPLPYAVAFAALPACVWLARPDRSWPPAWVLVAGSLLGIGAHLLNTLPDLVGDVATGVVGLPHRIGARAVRVVAPLVLLAATAVVVLRPGAAGMGAAGWIVLAAGATLATAAVLGRGKAPFLAAMVLAGTDVLAIVLVPPA